ncbi:GNAT family N-acetyltransferase [Verrucomicrobiaceae bacterium 5K15]|uniref:GNAT family N-acetyltransferase n=1 Tax=Oceaniferula flava TaxID=2800421 RepID=A0AAE2VBR3_9BACT|nr:GNAT family N-acetyltransferase [Oceaniferula flavus]MBK1854805.1 GNAT family N-acetyltransferase [Oceaniferula flavus]MBM1136111.1 GNAT family N-acetyltransferase [Oceaniferula flavus]
MKLITPTDHQLNDHHRDLFQQGAGVIATDGDLSAGLWFDHTPEYQGRKIGTIGGCEINEAAAGFLSDCADYLHREHQCQTVVGPMNGNTWQQHRLVLDSNGRDPFFMEPIEPAHFLETFRAAGFEELSSYSSSSVDLTATARDFASLEKRLQAASVTIRPIDPAKFESDLGAIFDLSLISFANNFLYTPLKKSSFVGKYMSAQDHIDPDLVLLVERDDDLVGFVFCMPDLFAVKQGKPPAIIVKTLAVLPERNLSGLGSLLVFKAQAIAKSKGYTEAIHALQYQSNSSRRISDRFDAKIFRQYALMAKTFTQIS